MRFKSGEKVIYKGDLAKVLGYIHDSKYCKITTDVAKGKFDEFTVHERELQPEKEKKVLTILRRWRRRFILFKFLML